MKLPPFSSLPEFYAEYPEEMVQSLIYLPLASLKSYVETENPIVAEEYTMEAAEAEERLFNIKNDLIDISFEKERAQADLNRKLAAYKAEYDKHKAEYDKNCREAQIKHIEELNDMDNRMTTKKSDMGTCQWHVDYCKDLIACTSKKADLACALLCAPRNLPYATAKVGEIIDDLQLSTREAAVRLLNILQCRDKFLRLNKLGYFHNPHFIEISESEEFIAMYGRVKEIKMYQLLVGTLDERQTRLIYYLGFFRLKTSKAADFSIDAIGMEGHEARRKEYRRKSLEWEGIPPDVREQVYERASAKKRSRSSIGGDTGTGGCPIADAVADGLGGLVATSTTSPAAEDVPGDDAAASPSSKRVKLA